MVGYVYVHCLTVEWSHECRRTQLTASSLSTTPVRRPGADLLTSTKNTAAAAVLCRKLACYSWFEAAYKSSRQSHPAPKRQFGSRGGRRTLAQDGMASDDEQPVQVGGEAAGADADAAQPSHASPEPDHADPLPSEQGGWLSTAAAVL